MKKVIAYHTVTGNFVADLDKEVNQYLAEGWVLLHKRTSVFMVKKMAHYQTMVKYEEREKIPEGRNIRV